MGRLVNTPGANGVDSHRPHTQDPQEHPATPTGSRWTELLPPLSGVGFKELKASIEKQGVLQPIEYAADGDLLDGFHRLLACHELGIGDVPRITRGEIKTDAEKRALVVALNLQRRHLTAIERRALIGQILVLDAERSDRQVAKQAGVDHKTVAKVRKEAEASGEIPQTEKRKGADGRKRPANRSKFDPARCTDDSEALKQRLDERAKTNGPGTQKAPLAPVPTAAATPIEQPAPRPSNSRTKAEVMTRHEPARMTEELQVEADRVVRKILELNGDESYIEDNVLLALPGVTNEGRRLTVEDAVGEALQAVFKIRTFIEDDMSHADPQGEVREMADVARRVVPDPVLTAWIRGLNTRVYDARQVLDALDPEGAVRTATASKETA